MKQVSFSLRTEKLTSKNFIKNFNHSNRNEDNINDKFLGKNIDKKRLKDNIFLVNNNEIFDNAKSIDEVWEIMENDFKNRTDNFKEIRYKLARIKDPETNKYISQKDYYKEHGDYLYELDKEGNKIIDLRNSKKNSRKLQRTTTKKENVNGKNISKKVESSPLQEHIIYVGGKDDICFNEDYQYREYYQYMLNEFNKEVDGQTVKAVVHFDEATPHLHIFQSQYNFENGQWEKEFNKTRDNYKKLQRNLKHKSQEYLKKFGIKHKPKQEENREHLSVKEYKKSQTKKLATEKDLKVKTNKNVDGLFEKNDTWKGLDKEQLKKEFKQLLYKSYKENFVNLDYEELKRERAIYQDLSNKLNSGFTQFEEIKKGYENQINDLNTNIKNLQSKITDLSNENKNLKSDIEEKVNEGVRAKISFNMSKHQETEKELKDLKSNYKDSENTIKDLEAKLKIESKKVENLNKKVSELSSVDKDLLIQELQNKVKELSNNKSLINAKLNERKIENLEKSNEELQQKNTELKSKNSNSLIKNIKEKEIKKTLFEGYFQGLEKTTDKETLEAINNKLDSVDSFEDKVKILIEENTKQNENLFNNYKELEKKIDRIENPEKYQSSDMSFY